MSRWQIDEDKLDGYWNPPRPVSPVTLSSSSSSSGRSSQASTIVEDFGGPQLRQRRDANSSDCYSPFGDIEDNMPSNHQEAKRQKICDDGSSSETSDDVEILPPPPSNVETINLEDSDEEDDYDVCIRKQLLLSQNEKESQEKGAAGGPGPASKKQETAEERANRYVTKFLKLRHFYDKLKQELAEERKKSSEIKNLEGMITHKSLEIMDLQTSVGRKDAQLHILQGKVNLLKKELEVERAKGSNASSDLVQENYMLKKKNKGLFEEMKVLVCNQFNAFNANKTMLETTYQSYKRMIQVAGNNVEDSLESPSKPEEGLQQEGSGNYECDPSEVTILSVSKNHVRGPPPSDPRLR